MARRRFFVPGIQGNTAELRGDDARHLARVLRAGAGQRYEISDGRAAYLAEVAEAGGHTVVFRVLEPLEPPAPTVHLTLCAALVKFDRFEWSIEKATELGAAGILPVESARSEKGLLEASRKRAERWKRIAHESGQQSRRLRPPEILPAVRFAQALEYDAGVRYFLDEETAPPLLRILPDSRSAADHVALLVGPEGGWTDDERRQASAAGWRAASLGPLVLRAETAAVAALAVIGNAWLP